MRQRIGEMVSILVVLSIVVGIPIAILMSRNTIALNDAPEADVVVIFAGRNDGVSGTDGEWIVEYANIPIHKDENGLPVIHAERGQRIFFRLTGKDVTHGIAIKEYGIDVKVRPGTYEEVDFIATKTGMFRIECSVFCGLGHHGMVANLMVEG